MVPTRFLLALFLCLSVARAEDLIEVEADADAVIVRSSIGEGNFLMRLPAGFKQIDPPEGFDIALASDEVQVRLRLSKPGTASAKMFVAARKREYEKGFEKLTRSGSGGRFVFVGDGTAGGRRVLVVFDGERAYELFLDYGKGHGAAMAKVAAGFTILDPRGAPEAPAEAATEDIKSGTIAKPFYRLKVYRPGGFREMPVDPDSDKGIVLHLRRIDAQKQACEIYIRVWLTSQLKQSIETRAANRLAKFENKYDNAKLPRRAKKARWPASKSALKARLLGRQRRTGIVVVEEWRFVEHENGRTYEIQMTMYGTVERDWRKDLKAFWRKLKTENR